VIGDADGKTKKKKKGESPPDEARVEAVMGEAIGGAH
jgi:hypothetical protein